MPTQKNAHIVKVQRLFLTEKEEDIAIHVVELLVGLKMSLKS